MKPCILTLPLEPMEKLYRALHLDITRQDDRNIWFLILEIFWASILASAASFNGAYAVHLGATNTDIAWLNSIPALLAVIVSFPVGRFLQSRSQLKPWILWALTVYRLSYAMMAIIPLVQLAHLSQGTLSVLWLIGWTAPATFFNVGFTPMLADVIPEEKRAATFTARNVVLGAAVSAFNFLFGQWLYYIAFPLNYQVMYLVGVVTSMMSIYYLSRIKVPAAVAPPPAPVKIRLNLPQQIQVVRRSIRDYPGFFLIVLNTSLYGIGLWLAQPLYIIYYVRILHASDAWIGLQGTVGSLATIFGYTLFRWIMARWGVHNTLKRTIITQGLVPVMVALAPSLTLILVAVAFNGLVASGINLSQYITLLKLIPEDRRASYSAIYTGLVNIGIFICPLVGVSLANAFGFVPSLIVFGLLSCIGAFSFWLWPVIKEQPDSLAEAG